MLDGCVFSVFVHYLVLIVIIFIIKSSNIITHSEALVDFHVFLPSIYFFQIFLFTCSPVPQAGMHIYARAAARGKRVQVNTHLFPLSLKMFLL